MTSPRENQCSERGVWPSNVVMNVAGMFVSWGMTLSLLGGCGAQQRPDGGKGLLTVGAEAPELTGRDAAGNSVLLSEKRGKPAVVYFYPKDETPGCTKEACAFRDEWNRFSAEGVTVFGVSRDSEASHVEFRTKHELPFPLVADESGQIQAAYGVPSRMGMAARVSFLVDGTGHIAKVWPDVDPAIHSDEVLKAAEALPGAAKPVAPTAN
jgi:peroxiredoxin Q/BCP